MEDRYRTFTVLINKISRNIRKIKNQEMIDYDLRSPHISCLYYLYSSEGLSASDLCSRCEEDKATISRSLDYLEANGYLTRKPDPSRPQKSLLSLTEKGRQAAKQVDGKIDKAFQSITPVLTEQERATLYKALSSISDSLESIREQGLDQQDQKKG